MTEFDKKMRRAKIETLVYISLMVIIVILAVVVLELAGVLPDMYG